MKEKFNLMDTMRLFWDHWWKIVIAAVVVAFLSLIFTVYCITPMYSARGTLYINNSGIGNEEDNPLYANLTDIATAQQLAFTCAKILTSETFMSQVQEAENLPYTAQQLQRMVRMEPVDETEILGISVSSPSPEHSQTIINTIMELSTDEIHRVVGAGNVRVIDKASMPLAPSSPNVMQNTLIGFVFGALLCAAVIFMIDFFDKRIKIEADLMNIKELPMLGVIPEIESLQKEGTENER